MEDGRVAALAGELGVTVAELDDARRQLTAGIDEAIAGGLVRFEDALAELAG